MVVSLRTLHQMILVGRVQTGTNRSYSDWSWVNALLIVAPHWICLIKAKFLFSNITSFSVKVTSWIYMKYLSLNSLNNQSIDTDDCLWSFLLDDMEMWVSFYELFHLYTWSKFDKRSWVYEYFLSQFWNMFLDTKSFWILNIFKLNIFQNSMSLIHVNFI